MCQSHDINLIFESLSYNEYAVVTKYDTMLYQFSCQI
jgi:hypothetical protein